MEEPIVKEDPTMSPEGKPKVKFVLSHCLRHKETYKDGGVVKKPLSQDVQKYEGQVHTPGQIFINDY